MSYLDFPRIVFSGDFISDVSTVNNDPAHYNNETFKPNFQEYGNGGTNGWWNPEGGATFDFKDCSIKRVIYADGKEETSNQSAVLMGQLIKSPGGRSVGKMVDLDPQQQGVSQLWAVKLQISSIDGTVLLTGDIEATAFRDLQLRQLSGVQINRQPYGASWTSVLKNIVWENSYQDYRVLKELKEKTNQNKLSINLNAFGYYYSHAADGRFSLGCLIGAIGPWFDNEPNTFLSERRLFATKLLDPSDSDTSFGISNFKYNSPENRLSIDLGNSFPIADALGTTALNTALVVAVSKNPLTNSPSISNVLLTANDVIEIGSINYAQGRWIMEQGGIFDFENAPKLLATQQLLLLNKNDTNYSLIARESIDGFNIRAEEMVIRLDSSSKKEVFFFAKQWGQPINNDKIEITLIPPTLSKPSPICEIPGTGFPEDGISFSSNLIAVNNGKGSFIITGNEIHSPRGYIDGQIYFIAYNLATKNPDPADTSNDAISVHLRDYFAVPDKPKWSDIEYTMKQFSNLYPIMSKYIVDLGNRDAVLAKKEILLFAFGQDIDSPIYMPVTRDLSEGKRLTILKWLKSDGIYDNDETIAKDNSLKKDFKMTEIEAKKFSNSEFYQKLSMAMKMKMGEKINSKNISKL